MNYLDRSGNEEIKKTVSGLSGDRLSSGVRIYDENGNQTGETNVNPMRLLSVRVNTDINTLLDVNQEDHILEATEGDQAVVGTKVEIYAPSQGSNKIDKPYHCYIKSIDSESGRVYLSLMDGDINNVFENPSFDLTAFLPSGITAVSDYDPKCWVSEDGLIFQGRVTISSALSADDTIINTINYGASTETNNLFISKILYDDQAEAMVSAPTLGSPQEERVKAVFEEDGGNKIGFTIKATDSITASTVLVLDGLFLPFKRT